MFRHVVMFDWNDDASPEARAAAVDALRRWGVAAAEFGTLTVGTDAGLAEGNADVVVVVDFPDREAYAGYAADPRHLDMIAELIRPIVGRRSAVQHEL